MKLQLRFTSLSYYVYYINNEFKSLVFLEIIKILMCIKFINKIIIKKKF